VPEKNKEKTKDAKGIFYIAEMFSTPAIRIKRRGSAKGIRGLKWNPLKLVGVDLLIDNPAISALPS